MLPPCLAAISACFPDSFTEPVTPYLWTDHKVTQPLNNNICYTDFMQALLVRHFMSQNHLTVYY